MVTPKGRAGSRRLKEHPEPGLTCSSSLSLVPTFFPHPQPSAIVLVWRGTVWAESGWLPALGMALQTLVVSAPPPFTITNSAGPIRFLPGWNLALDLRDAELKVVTTHNRAAV